MRTPKSLLPFFVGLLVIIIFAAQALSQTAVPMLINYQGELRSPRTGEPVADGLYDMTFTLYADELDPTPLWRGDYSRENRNPAEVRNGIFNVVLGSGEGNALGDSVFGRPNVWLEITIERETLKPRQRIASTAYSMVSENSRLLGGKEPSEFVIQAQGLRLETNADCPNILAGYASNAVTAGAVGATIGGGGTISDANLVADHYGTVSGGAGNQAGDNAGTTDDAHCATVGGGYWNTASNSYATVPGGCAAVARCYGQHAYASGGFSGTVATAQTSLYVLRKVTTGTVPTELFLDGVGERMSIPVGSTWAFEALVVGRSQDSGIGVGSAGFVIRGLVQNAGGLTLIKHPTVDVLFKITTCDAIAEADDTQDALVIKVIGVSDAPMRWVAAVRTAEVMWPE